MVLVGLIEYVKGLCPLILFVGNKSIIGIIGFVSEKKEQIF